MSYNSAQKVFDCDDLKKYIFNFYPIKCKSCRKEMHRKFVNSHYHHHRDSVWRETENEFCRGYCNWCCIYVFEHRY